MNEEWRKEAEEIPIEERLGNMLQMAVGISEDLTYEQIKDLVSVLPESSAKGLENLLLTDPSIKKMVIKGAIPWLNTYIARIREAHDEGKKIVLTSFNQTPEIFYALDCVPASAEILTSFASILLDGYEVYLDWSEEEGLLDTMCTAQRGVNGAILRGLGPKPDFCCTFAPGSCDQNSKQFEFMAHRLDIPYLTADAPTHHDERSLEYYRKEFRDLISQIEEITGNKLDPDKLKKVVKESEKCREYYQEITDLSKAHPNPVPNIAWPFYHGMKFSSCGTEEGTNLAKSILDCSKKRYKQGIGAKPEEKIRQAWIYTGFYFPSMELWFWLERNGMSYVTDVLSFFHAEVPMDTSNTDSMIDGLARRNFNYPMTRQQSGPMDAPGSWLEDYLWIINGWDVDAGIFSGHLACKNAWGAVRPLTKAIRKETGVPTLELEGDSWDRRITPLSTIQENIEEFNETMGLL